MTTKTDFIYDWVDERLGLSDLAAFARKKTVPVHAQSFWYYWGGISLFLFLVQCFTGVLLLVYYRPGADSFESVRQITYVMHFGWLIRSAHAWSANLMMFAILVHMFSVYFMKAYRKPREFGWLSGMALLGLASVFGFSGYLLPMDELSYFATKVGLEIPAAIPWIGPVIGNMLRGGLEVNEFTVQRFFALHVVVLPALFLPCSAFTSGWCSATAMPCRLPKKPSRFSIARPCRSFPTSCAKIWACGLSRLTFWRCWPRSFRGRLASRQTCSCPRRREFIPSGTS